MLVARLSDSDLEAIDQALLGNSRGRWLKLARIIGDTTIELELQYPELPDTFYALRVSSLVERGLLEAQGNLAYMRFSEIRHPQGLAPPRQIP